MSVCLSNCIVCNTFTYHFCEWSRPPPLFACNTHTVYVQAAAAPASFVANRNNNYELCTRHSGKISMPSIRGTHIQTTIYAICRFVARPNLTNHQLNRHAQTDTHISVNAHHILKINSYVFH